MKKKYLIVIILFMLIMSGILYYFSIKRNNIKLLNEANSLLKYIYELDNYNSEYTFVNGYLSIDSNEINKKFNIDGNGIVNVDKYGNVKFYINNDGYCINKTSVGDIELLNEECDKFEELNVKIIKNNTTISFTSLDEELEYKVSSNDDFSGEWIKEEYNDNLIIHTFREGKNYIWFKNKYGTISDVLTFEIDCLNANNALYDENKLYCSGSVVKIDNIDYIVIEDKMSSIKLMMKDNLDIKLSHCTDYESDYCYKTNDKEILYNWDNSYINYYLNNVFINSLSNNIKRKLISSEVCSDNINYSCNNELCVGNRKEIIESKKYNCNSYTSSKIRLIDYYEYNYIYSRIGNNKLIEGEFWIINSYNENKGSIVDSSYSVYVLEDTINTNYVRPLIILDKNK